MPVTICLTNKLIIPDNDILNISWQSQIVISTINLPKLQVEQTRNVISLALFIVEEKITFW